MQLHQIRTQTQVHSYLQAAAAPGAEATQKFSLELPSVPEDILSSLVANQSKGQDCLNVFPRQVQHTTTFCCGFSKPNPLFVVTATCLGASKQTQLLGQELGEEHSKALPSPQLCAMQCPAIPPWKLSTRLLKKLASLLNQWCVIKNKYKQPFGLPVLNTTLLNQVNDLLAEDSKKNRQQTSPVFAPHLLEQDICRLLHGGAEHSEH